LCAEVVFSCSVVVFRVLVGCVLVYRSCSFRSPVAMTAEQVFTTVLVRRLFVFNMQTSLHFREIRTYLKWRLKATGGRGEGESPLVCFLINAQ